MIDMIGRMRRLELMIYPRVGQYLMGLPASGATTFAVATGILFSNLMYIARDITIDRIGIDVTTQAGAGGVCYLGIYDITSVDDFTPLNLRVDYGTLVTTATGILAITIAPALALPKGFYWFAITHNNSTPVATCRTSQEAWCPVGFRTSNFNPDNLAGQWYANHVYAALPATFPVAGAGTYDGRANLALPRVASLA